MDPNQWMSMMHMGDPKTHQNFMEQWMKMAQKMAPPAQSK